MSIYDALTRPYAELSYRRGPNLADPRESNYTVAAYSGAPMYVTEIPQQNPMQPMQNSMQPMQNPMQQHEHVQYPMQHRFYEQIEYPIHCKKKKKCCKKKKKCCKKKCCKKGCPKCVKVLEICGGDDKACINLGPKESCHHKEHHAHHEQQHQQNPMQLQIPPVPMLMMGPNHPWTQHWPNNMRSWYGRFTH